MCRIALQNKNDYANRYSADTCVAPGGKQLLVPTYYSRGAIRIKIINKLFEVFLGVKF